jgi:hypothetical protein
LAKWRYNTWKQDRLRAVRPQYFLLSNKAIDILVKINPSSLINYQQITLAIGETKAWERKWAKEVFDVVRCFDAEVGVLEEQDRLEEMERRKRHKEEDKRAKEESIQRAFQQATDSHHHRAQAMSISREEAVRRLQQLRDTGSNSQSTSQFQPADKQAKTTNAFEMDTLHRQQEAERKAREMLAQMKGRK